MATSAVVLAAGLVVPPSVSADEVASISGTVWEDTNGDAIHGSGDRVLPGLVVGALKPNGSLAASGETDEKGRYTFDDLPADNYRIEVLLPAGTVLVRPNAGTDDADSDLDWATHQSEPLPCSSGECAVVDAGLTTAKPDLAMVVEPAEVTLPPGENGHSTAVVRNTGNVPSPGLMVMVPYHDALSKAPTGQGWYCHPTRQGYVCTIGGYLVPGATSAAMSVPLTAKGNLPASVELGVGMEGDIKPDDNTAQILVHAG